MSTGTAAATPIDDAPIDDAVIAAVAQADEQGITSYITVVDRLTGEVVSESANARVQVASESIMKLFLASYYATEAGGSDLLSPQRRASLEEMITFSDDDIASALFTVEAIPSQAQRYGLTDTANADNPGEWGAARITANDMAVFLYRMSVDPLVGPWLMTVLAQTSPTAADGFDQDWGLNALSGGQGSKQGWGSENWTAERNAVHSVGFTDTWFAAVLQTGGSGTYYTMHDTATDSARLIQSAPRAASGPVGILDPVTVQDGVVTVSGWVVDPTDRAASISVDIAVDPSGASTRRMITDLVREDINIAVGATGAHGFTATLPLSAGASRICVTGVDSGDAADTQLGCFAVAVADDEPGSPSSPAGGTLNGLVAMVGVVVLEMTALR